MTTYVSQNGYTAAPTSAGIPGGCVKIHPKGAEQVSFVVRAGDVATILQYVVDQYQARVEDIALYTKPGGDDWSYYFRAIRSLVRKIIPGLHPFCGDTAAPASIEARTLLAGVVRNLSNHSSATAIDINATRHPLGVAASKTFTKAQLATMRAIIAELRGVVRAGAFYSGRPDGMHWEIVGTLAQIKAVAADIRSGKIHGPAAPPPVPVPPVVAPSVTGYPKPKTADVYQSKLVPGQKDSDSVWWLQRALNLVLDGPDLTLDAEYGPQTATAVKRFQVEECDDPADGAIGPRQAAFLFDLAHLAVTVRP